MGKMWFWGWLKKMRRIKILYLRDRLLIIYFLLYLWMGLRIFIGLFDAYNDSLTFVGLISLQKERGQIIEWYKDQRLMHLLNEHSNRFSAAWLPARHFCMHPRLLKVQSKVHFPIATTQASSHAVSSPGHSCLRQICWAWQTVMRRIARRIFVIDIISQLLIIWGKYSNNIEIIIKIKKYTLRVGGKVGLAGVGVWFQRLGGFLGLG